MKTDHIGKKYLFSLDVETDSLYGEVFAIGVTVWNMNPVCPEIVDRFEGVAEIYEVRDQWAVDTIVPLVTKLKPFNTRRQMRDAFWDFYIKYREDSIIMADFGAPCEARLFADCIKDDLTDRMWKGPYPLHDLGTLIYAAGKDPDLDRHETAIGTCHPEARRLVRHNPVSDSVMAAIIWFSLRDDIIYGMQVAEAMSSDVLNAD